MHIAHYRGVNCYNYLGLAGEKIRWEATAENLEIAMGYLVGDCLVASAFLSYMGPFLSNYRDEMVEKIWLKQVNLGQS